MPLQKGEEILLHHDNARPHVAYTVTEFLVKRGIRTVSHPPYSSDLTSCDFWLSQKLKKLCVEVRFESNQRVIKAVKTPCKELSKNELSFVFQKWQKWWTKCHWQVVILKRTMSVILKKVQNPVTDVEESHILHISYFFFVLQKVVSWSCSAINMVPHPFFKINICC